MGIFSGIFKSRDAPTNRTAGSAYSFFLGQSAAGKRVNERSAMQTSAVYACVRVISESVASLPLHVYKYNKKEFKTEYKNYLKDSDYKRHYMLVKNNVKETANENLCGFYRKNLLISYAVQYKNNLRTVYYYDALGNLRYIVKFSENYPNFPYMSKQYRANGTLVSAIYFMSHDMQYMYNNDATFQGAWYKDKMYNRHAKQVLTRTNW